MNRRNFFKKLSGAVVGCYLGCQIKLPEKWEVNPEWEKAEYEVEFVFGSTPLNKKFKIPIIYYR